MQSSALANKQVLLMAPGFFEYYSAIKRELELLGATVYVIKEDFVNTSTLYRYFFVKSEHLKYRFTSNYYKRQLDKLEDNIDVVFVIRGEAISEDIMLLLKEKYPNAYYLMYQWDSIKNNPNAVKISSYFNKCSTFDPLDAEKLNWRYRPLFFIQNEDEVIANNKKNIDFIFVGTLYYRRAELLKKIKSYCKTNKYVLFDYLYVKKLEYFVHKYLMRDQRYSILNTDEVKFRPLSTDEISRYYKKTKIFVDYAADSQNGLTMRTIESIGNRSKIITNNKNILNADFYNTNNIYLYDINEFTISETFINTPYEELSNKIFYKYSLKGWIEDIFGEYLNENSK